MGIAIDTETRGAAESLIAWWRDAGVDVEIDESPRDWLAEAPVGEADSAASMQSHQPSRDLPRDIGRGAATEGSRPEPLNAVPPTPLPGTLPDFLAWLATDTAHLADFPVRRRLPPEGSPECGLMVVGDMPERSDADAGRLLTGECGALFEKMLSALGRERSAVYLATLAPARTPTGMIDAKTQAVLAPILNQHIRLAAPAKLWLIGDAASRAVLGMDVRAATGKLHIVNHDGGTLQAIATVHPQVLLREPKLKAGVWRDMQMLIEGRNA